mmetsp:Transcript_7738/g.24348  ORF Transcript_7738/g.24348 Transcript_7738/m.24348 type:complete len:168 (+) Transcript_7738:196-699(+)
MVGWLYTGARSARRMLKNGHDSGSLYIGAGAVTLAFGGLMALDEYRSEKRMEALHAIRFQIKELTREQEAAREARKNAAKFTERAPEWSATITRRVHASACFDGPLALRDAAVGQAVQVLESDVGPDQGYHDVRNEFGEGLYPKAYIKADIPRDDGVRRDAAAAKTG